MRYRNLKYDIYVISNKIGHHSEHSGYNRLIDYLDPLTKQIVVEEAGYSAQMIYHMIRKNIGKDWYSPRSLRAEARILKNCFHSGKALYHFMYGEDDFRYAGWAKRINKDIRIVSTYHQPPAIFETVVRSRKHMKSLDAIIALGSNQVPFFEDLLGAEHIFLVPHGIDTDFFRPSNKLTEPKKRKTCLFVGQWLRDFRCLRDVIRIIADKNTNILFEIITPESNRKELDDLDTIKIEFNVSENSLLTSYQNADIMVLPLTDCTANNSILEAMASGLPLVTTDIGGIRDYVNETCAFLTPQGDAETMASKVLLLAEDEALRLQLSVAAREKAVGEFAWTIVANRISEVYKIIAET